MGRTKNTAPDADILTGHLIVPSLLNNALRLRIMRIFPERASKRKAGGV